VTPTATIKKRENSFVASLRPLLARPQNVLLNEQALSAFACRIAPEQFPVPCWREVVFPKLDDEEFVNFIGIGNAINFAFTDFDTHQSFCVHWAGQEWRGAFAMWACLSRAHRTGTGILRAAYLRDLTLKNAKQIFAGTPELPMLEERVRNLREVGTILGAKYGGSFWNLVRASKNSATGPTGVLERLVTDFPAFRDEGRYLGNVLQFQKRAQLFAMMYEGRARSSAELPRLENPDLIGPIADYDIPRVLHSVGVLEYLPELEQKLRTWQPIQANSLEEMEIRAQTIKAQILLLARVNELRSRENIDFLALDYKLWRAGRELREPHHLTKTSAY